jgi:hypothetical protein
MDGAPFPRAKKHQTENHGTKHTVQCMLEKGGDIGDTPLMVMMTIATLPRLGLINIGRAGTLNPVTRTRSANRRSKSGNGRLGRVRILAPLRWGPCTFLEFGIRNSDSAVRAV